VLFFRWFSCFSFVGSLAFLLLVLVLLFFLGEFDLAGPLGVIGYEANMVGVWITTLVGSYASCKSLRCMSTVGRKGRNWIVAGIL